MKRRGQQRTLAHDHGLPVGGGEHLDIRPGLLDPRSPDEDRVHRPARHPGDIEVALEGVDLAAEGVTADGDVEAPDERLTRVAVQDGAREQDHPCARAVHGQPPAHDGTQRLQQAEHAQQPPDGGRLAARKDEPVQPVELGGAAHDQTLGAGVRERLQVLPNVTLQGQHTHAGPAVHQPRSA